MVVVREGGKGLEFTCRNVFFLYTGVQVLGFSEIIFFTGRFSLVVNLFLMITELSESNVIFVEIENLKRH